MPHPIALLTVRTLEDVATELGLHRNTVARIERQALAKLRESGRLQEIWESQRAADPYLADYSWGPDWDMTYDQSQRWNKEF